MEAGSSSTRRDEETLETLETLETQVEEDDVPPTTYAQSFTPRSLFVGLAIGALITFSNTYFGLQTGWISVMTMPSSLIGFAVFRSLSRHLSFPFTPVENVLIQTVAGAVGTMPLGCGFVGVIPALEYLLRPGPDGPMDGSDGGDGEGGPLKLASWKLIVWSLGVCLFGVIFAVPLRKEVIVREKLKFPSGTATALMINVLHGATKPVDKGKGTTRRLNHSVDSPAETERLLASNDIAGVTLEHLEADRRRKHEWKAKIRMLLLAFGVSAIYTLLSYFAPVLRNLPVFGLPLANQWLWTLNPSPAYIGQGIIMGPSTSLHMLLGAVIGWAILSPLAKHNGWAPGPVNSWETGSKGWIVWVSLAIMLADSIINLAWLAIRPLVNQGPGFVVRLQYEIRRKRFWTSLFSGSSSSSHGYTAIHAREGRDLMGEDYDAPPSELISNRTVAILLPLALILNVVCMRIAFGDIISPFLSIAATLLALLLSIMGVRALGETDLNPVSGISKLTQLIFAAATPASHHTRRSAIVANLLAGAVSESGALQAGDMMQDLKTGHLLGASPKAQFYGQAIGSVVGAIISVGVYKLYVNVYPVPGPMFEVPTGYVWIFTARLVTGQGLPEMAWPAAGIACVIFTITTILRIVGTVSGPAGSKGPVFAPWRAWVPGGIAVAVGMYNVPSFTLARAIGGIIALVWQYRSKIMRDRLALSKAQSVSSPDGEEQEAPKPVNNDEDSTSSTIVILASGLILGEGIVSILNLILASAKVPHL
ncbi:Oligonucleotide transporter [Trichophyton interdigitale]|uniref:Oligonucleotide transporter n=1 Tax=Trichophyton interdigitale TaxID=101480 RepID=A0A9P4YG20_9EURO|nr:Oligonucleotide transporter [Trichophyton interdigitale]KAF3893665.1 Oligonucleotide transporter [Trichophyton interdigitale]KAG8207046.1 Oligonucleotide transporter [Trichophyton interdigitale]